MIQSLAELRQSASKDGRRTLAVAVAQDAEVLLAVDAAAKLGLADAILVGDEPEIRRIASEHSICLDAFPIEHEADKILACRKAVSLVREGRAGALMKGIVDTSIILKAVLDRENGLRKASVLSHVALFEIPGFDRLLTVTDVAMNIAPDLDAKRHILENAVQVLHALGNPNPIAAGLCAVEKVNPKMPATLDADALTAACRAGEISGCRVIGPVALDNAVSPAAARHKGISEPLAGYADILLAPDIEAGNILYKALVFLARAKNAGIIVGAKAPIVLTSRADSDETKLNSIALALAVAANTP